MKVFFCLLTGGMPKIYICFYISCRRALFCAEVCRGAVAAVTATVRCCRRYDMQVLHFVHAALPATRYF